jgi:hypothetical protein
LLSFDIIRNIRRKIFRKNKGIDMDAKQVAAELVKHEAVCAERWKTAFNRFDAIDKQVSRLETILIGAAGTIIAGGLGVLWTILSMHP